MKKILLLTTKYPEQVEQAWLTNELAECLFARGFDVRVIVLSWEFIDGESKFTILNGVKIHRLRLPKFFYKKTFICSVLKIISFSVLARWKFSSLVIESELIVATTPCISVWALLGESKGAYKNLILWDFFPYYMRDIWQGAKRLLFYPFLLWENSLYNRFNKISCMTNEAVTFLGKSYKIKRHIDVDIIPLWTKQKELTRLTLSERQAVRNAFNIKTDAFVVVYGGAITAIQNLSSVLDSAKKLVDDPSFQFVFIGSGPDLVNLMNRAASECIDNVLFVDRVSRDVYGQIVSACDVGIVSLSSLHSVPSFPSKSIDYLKVGLPIIANIDGTTEFGTILEKHMCAGFSVRSGNVEEFLEKLILMKSDASLRERFSFAGRKYYEENFNVEFAADNIVKGI